MSVPLPGGTPGLEPSGDPLLGVRSLVNRRALASVGLCSSGAGGNTRFLSIDSRGTVATTASEVVHDE